MAAHFLHWKVSLIQRHREDNFFGLSEALIQAQSRAPAIVVRFASIVIDRSGVLSPFSVLSALQMTGNKLAQYGAGTI